MNSKVVYLRLFCVFLLGMMSLSAMGMHGLSNSYPSEIPDLHNGLSGSNTLAPCTSTVNVTFIGPVQKNPIRHYLLPPTFEVTIENSSIITGFTVGLRCNETDLSVTRIYFSVELKGAITLTIWKASEYGVLEMIVTAKTSEDTATDSVWIIKDSFGDFLSRTWYFIVIGVILIPSVAIGANYLMNKRIRSKSEISEKKN